VDSVTITVPCSTSNLGSGFDTLGLALSLHNRITVKRASEAGVCVTGFATGEPAAAALGVLCMEAVDAFFHSTRLSSFGISVFNWTKTPIARGLGFSATLRAGLAGALNELSGARLSREGLVDLVTKLEGHPDNASPSILGGFTVSGTVENQTRCLRFDVDPSLKAVTLIPDFHVRTEMARELMPKQFSKSDAAHALNRSALVVAAFASKNYEALRGAFDDRFHQPYRLKLVPQLDRVIAAGVEAGAIGGFLSGSGSSIICLTRQNADEVATAMQSELRDSEVKILTPENDGLRVETT
jgi:homoserine kinase